MAGTEPTTTRASSPFRLTPPVPSRSLILRPRLLEILSGRFERRLTVLVGGAGFGKTSLLTQAITQNELDPRGRDIWVGCTSGDGAAHALALGMLDALDAVVEEDREPVESVLSNIWSFAPEPVCLILDDVHEIPPGSSSAEMLDRLVRELPANGHLVLSSRTPPPVRTGKLHASGELVVLGESALAFNEDEAMTFAELREVDVGAVAGAGGWPAITELRAGARAAASGDFLWEEVLEGLTAEQHDAIIRLAPFEAVDDELLQALGGPELLLADIAAFMPLAVLVDGSLRLHDLWRPVLMEAMQRADLPDRWYEPGIELLRNRGRFREAFDALLSMDDDEGLAGLVTELSLTDYPDLDTDDLLYVLKQLPAKVAATGHAMLLRGTMLVAVDIHSALETFGEALEHFRAVGDKETEAIAQIRRSSVMFILGDIDGMGEVVAELAELGAAGVERAARTVSLMGAFLELMGGDPRAAIATVEREGIRAEPELSVMAGYLVANASMELGHVRRSLAEAESVVVRSTGHLKVALRGLVLEGRTLLEPEDFEARCAEFEWLHGQAKRFDLPGSAAVTAAGLATYLASKGKLDDARRYLAEAHGAAVGVSGPHFLLGVALADVIVTFMEGDEDQARALAERMLADHPVGARPDRTYLVGFDAIYVLLPELRELLDDLDLGPEFEAYRVVAQAIVALREDHDLSLAAALPWDQPGHMARCALEPFLAELAAAASAANVDAAQTVLQEMSFDPHVMLRRAEARHSGKVATEAARLVKRIPARPVEPISLRVMGPLELRRGTKVVDDAGWARERVRSLALFVIDAGRVRRDRVAAALWGDMDDEASLNNLRVTLNHLQQTLQPERDRSSPPFFLRIESDHLYFVEDPMLSVDVWDFERLTTEAAGAESERSPSVALERHLAAVDLYRGAYLMDAPDWDWGYYERIRLQSLFVESAVRAGELLLARGEPREADRLAVRAAAEEPFAEPAHRLRARALLAAGDRAAARMALSSVIGELRSDGIEPEVATVELLDRL